MSNGEKADSVALDKLKPSRPRIKPPADEHVDPIDAPAMRAASTQRLASTSDLDTKEPGERVQRRRRAPATVQMNVRISLEADEQIYEIMVTKGITKKDAVEEAIRAYSASLR